ncbi:MAG: hypothetical protein E6G97_22755 [Alphaproteobacteria bacterium]|nr:MAG: hypothetical protein E6G97_22755 [Alphaproteobacteria bacterium]
MSYAHPIWLAGRRKYWTQPDAWRFAAPGSPEAKMPGWLDPWMTRVRAKEAAEEEARAHAAAEQEEFEREVLALRHDFAKLKLEHELWCCEQKYSPSQPRVPAGNPDGGQWTSGARAVGAAAAASPLADAAEQTVLSDATPDPIVPGVQSANVIRICMAGTRSISSDRWGNTTNWWVEYTCADGFSFKRYGFGGKIDPFVTDPRY